MEQRDRKVIVAALLFSIILVVVSLVLLYYSYSESLKRGDPENPIQTSLIKRFKSEAEFDNYLEELDAYIGGRDYDTINDAPPMAAPLEGGDGLLTEKDRYSGTNVQVLSIDEPDFVKTDGEYIYISRQSGYYYYEPIDPGIPVPEESEDSGGSSGDTVSDLVAEPPIKTDPNDISIIKAIPVSELKELAEIKGAGDLLISGNTLIIISNYSKISAYDISDPSQPIKTWELFVADDVSISAARLYNNELYLVTQKYLYENQPCDIRIFSGTEVDCTDIYYPDPTAGNRTTYTISKLDMFEGIITDTISFLGTGGTTVVYMSESSIYVTYPNWQRSEESTGIVKIDNSALDIEAETEVLGTLLNQFSLDEYEGHLRVATTVGTTVSTGSDDFIRWREENDIYVLDQNLKTIGSIEGIGIDERIYSVRFVGDKGYLVTFRQIDPFFVLDLSDPTNPEVSGELKIPGYSSYLHPVTDTMILGVGQEDNNVKLSLFDVSNPSSPVEISKYLLDDYWTEISSNHHAFLIDKDHKLFFIPGSNGGHLIGYEGDRLEYLKNIGDFSVTRALYIGDNLYVIGSEELYVYDENTLELINKITY